MEVPTERACGYCGKRLASVALIFVQARPTCGSAWCLQQALAEHEALRESEMTELRAA
jgi:hypothetical protein